MCSTQTLLAVISLDRTPQVSTRFQSWNLWMSLSGRPYECPRFRTRYKRFHKVSIRVFRFFRQKRYRFLSQSIDITSIKKKKIAMDPIGLDVNIITNWFIVTFIAQEGDFSSQSSRLRWTHHSETPSSSIWKEFHHSLDTFCVSKTLLNGISLHVWNTPVALSTYQKSGLHGNWPDWAEW